MALAPKGFFSYARDDDKHLGQMLTDLRARIAGEVSMLLGLDVDMFQDIHDLRTGDKWEETLRAAISTATFLVPVLTPRYFTRPWCREETLTFLRLARENGVAPLIFPVLFVKDGDPDPACEVRAALKAFQYKDFTGWRFLSSPTERARLESEYAEDVVARLRAQKGATNPKADSKAAKAPAVSATTSEVATEVRGEGAERSPKPPSFPVLVVDQMPGRGDHTSIQAAIDAAKPGSRILIRPGTYRESLRLFKPLELIGDGDRDRIVVTTDRGDALHCDAPMARIVGLTLRREADEGEDVGLWITAGGAEIEDCVITSRSLSGVQIMGQGTAPTLRRCRVVDGGKAGLLIHGGAQPIIEDCEFARSAFAGVEVRNEGTRATLRRCVARDNEGGFYFHDNATGLVDDCEAVGNGTSGMQVKTAAGPRVRNSRFRNNRQTGVFVNEGGGGRFENCIIVENDEVGVAVQDGGRPEVKSCKISGNGYEAIWIGDSESGGVFENNDLRGNKRGPWDIAKGAEKNLIRKDNKEK